MEFTFSSVFLFETRRIRLKTRNISGSQGEDPHAGEPEAGHLRLRGPGPPGVGNPCALNPTPGGKPRRKPKWMCVYLFVGVKNCGEMWGFMYNDMIGGSQVNKETSTSEECCQGPNGVVLCFFGGFGRGGGLKRRKRCIVIGRKRNTIGYGPFDTYHGILFSFLDGHPKGIPVVQSG